jgi:pyridoxal phosphate enzyme (YggS family)
MSSSTTSTAEQHIRENYEVIRNRIAAACERARRNPSEITVIGVTKTKPAEIVLAAADAGIANIGENYVQELLEKHDVLHTELDNRVQWHFIGHLQRNKVKLILPFISMIHAVDSERLGAEIDKQAALLGRRIPVLLQVNTSGEESKFGVTPEGAPELGRKLAAFPNLDLQGLMTLAAFLDDPEATRPMFQLLRQTRDRLRDETSLPLTQLSMGMTSDFEVAVEEGATMVRIGTALFGERLKGEDMPL